MLKFCLMSLKLLCSHILSVFIDTLCWLQQRGVCVMWQVLMIYVPGVLCAHKKRCKMDNIMRLKDVVLWVKMKTYRGHATYIHIYIYCLQFTVITIEMLIFICSE